MSKILFIEDEADIRDIVCEILELEEFEIICATNGQSGLALAQQHQPDLILCDISMPEMDGYEVLSQVRQTPAIAPTPFIFITAKAEKRDQRQGMQLGADDYLTKPFSRDELLAAIAAQVNKKQTIDQNWQQKLNDLRANITLSLPHELHTPLSGIMGLSELLIDGYDTIPKEDAIDMLNAVRTSAERLYRLTQNFLLYAELEILASDSERTGALSKLCAITDVRMVIEAIASKVAQRAQRSKDLQIHVAPLVLDLPDVKLDKIAEELIDNAFKFSQPGTPVTVSVSCTDHHLYLTVVNQGRGMTPEQIAHVGAYMQFERRLYEQQGSGLGLTIVKRLTELHQGQFQIESVPDQTTTVSITLPLSPPN